MASLDRPADPIADGQGGLAAPAQPVAGYRGVLASGAFRWLWLSQVVAGTGEALASVALPLLVYGLTGSTRLLGLVFVVGMAPRVLLAPLAGLLVDRLDRRRLMMVTHLGRAAAVCLLPWASSVWQIGAVVAVVAIGNAFFRPAELAAVPMIVAGDRLVPALSLVQVTGEMVSVLGPALAAGIVGGFGPRPAFGIQALCFLAAAGCLARLTLPRAAPLPDAEAGARRAPLGLWEGLRVTLRNPIVRGITAVEALWGLVGAVLTVDAVVYVERVAGLGDRAGSTFAWLMATFSGGAAIGALLASRIERRIGRRRLMAIGYLGPLFLLPADRVPPLWILFACWLALGLTDAWAVIGFQAYLAEAVPDALRGRVYAIGSGIITLAALGWYPLAGWLTPYVGAPRMLALGGGLVGVGGPLLLVVTGALAAMRDHRQPRRADADPAAG